MEKFIFQHITLSQSAPLLRGYFALIGLGVAAAPQFVDAAWRQIDYCVYLRVKPQIHTLEYTLLGGRPLTKNLGSGVERKQRRREKNPESY